MVSSAAQAHLADPAVPSVDALRSFQDTGYLLVRQLLDPQALAEVSAHVAAAVRRAPPPRPPQNAYEAAFQQVVNAGLDDIGIAALTHGARIGAFAAGLMQQPAARIFVEDIFVKAAQGEHTPWHQDQSVCPVEAPFVTAWIPLVDVPANRGGLRMIPGSHQMGLVGPIDINEASDQAFKTLIEDRNLDVYEAPAMHVGDVHFHDGRTVHAARPNGDTTARPALAIHLFGAPSRIRHDLNEGMRNILDRLAPGLAPGDPAESPQWPLVFHG